MEAMQRRFSGAGPVYNPLNLAFLSVSEDNFIVFGVSMMNAALGTGWSSFKKAKNKHR